MLIDSHGIVIHLNNLTFMSKQVRENVLYCALMLCNITPNTFLIARLHYNEKQFPVFQIIIILVISQSTNSQN